MYFTVRVSILDPPDTPLTHADRIDHDFLPSHLAPAGAAPLVEQPSGLFLPHLIRFTTGRADELLSPCLPQESCCAHSTYKTPYLFFRARFTAETQPTNLSASWTEEPSGRCAPFLARHHTSCTCTPYASESLQQVRPWRRASHQEHPDEPEEPRV